MRRTAILMTAAALLTGGLALTAQQKAPAGTPIVSVFKSPT